MKWCFRNGNGRLGKSWSHYPWRGQPSARLPFSKLKRPWVRVGHFFSALFQAVRRNLMLFAMIVLVLVAGKWVRSEWVHVQNVVGDLPVLQAAQRDVSHRQTALAHGLSGQMARLSGASVQQLDAHISELDSEISLLQRAPATVSLASGALVQQLQQRAMRGVEIEARRQARAHLMNLRTHAAVLIDRQAALRQREQLRLNHVRAHAALQQTEQQLAQSRATGGVLARLPFTSGYRQVQRLERDAISLRAANSRASREYLAQQAVLERLTIPVALSQFEFDAQRLAEAGQPLRERLRQAEALAATSRLWQAYRIVRPVLPLALALLAGWWLIPAAMRALFYFVLAPLAERRPPMVISATQGMARAARDGSIISALSHRLTLDPDHELLIRPDYCQSQAAGVRFTTRWLFDWRNPFTSIAAQLYMLKRVRTQHAAAIVVSATAEALDEVALLEIAPGGAMVLQPRALVGMLYKSGQRPTIRSHWRLGTLHAWLTLQLRYLAFEGPVTLIVKGCRGVRLESAATGRSISQDATLGFSADARYATVRADPFIPYLRGRQPLFHDKFDGVHACYLYEEVPRNARRGGGQRNPLEGLLDAGLKAFGI